MSTKPNDGGPAFPATVQHYFDCSLRYQAGYGGMSLRDWFAGMALQGLMANGHGYANMADEAIAENSWNAADAMIAQRNGKEDA